MFELALLIYLISYLLGEAIAISQTKTTLIGRAIKFNFNCYEIMILIVGLPVWMSILIFNFIGGRYEDE